MLDDIIIFGDVGAENWREALEREDGSTQMMHGASEESGSDAW